MKKHTDPIECNRFYHIYNRGVNGETIFKEERNYVYFLKKYAHYIQPVAETFAYCLLKNHFHLLIRTRTADEILQNLREINVVEVQNLDDVQRSATFEEKEAAYKLAAHQVSNQFAKLFNGYSQAINKTYNRTGGLFETPIRRVPVENEVYFLELVYYIHANPQKHGFVADFRDYPHSSYHAHLSKSDTKLKRQELLSWFGDSLDYQKYHLPNQILKNLEKFEIEFD